MSEYPKSRKITQTKCNNINIIINIIRDILLYVLKINICNGMFKNIKFILWDYISN